MTYTITIYKPEPIESLTKESAGIYKRVKDSEIKTLDEILSSGKEQLQEMTGFNNAVFPV